MHTNIHLFSDYPSISRSLSLSLTHTHTHTHMQAQKRFKRMLSWSLSIKIIIFIRETERRGIWEVDYVWKMRRLSHMVALVPFPLKIGGRLWQHLQQHDSWPCPRASLKLWNVPLSLLLQLPPFSSPLSLSLSLWSPLRNGVRNTFRLSLFVCNSLSLSQTFAQNAVLAFHWNDQTVARSMPGAYKEQ